MWQSTHLMFNTYQDGIMRTVGSISELPDNSVLSRQRVSCGTSKAEKLLGSGTGDIIIFLRKYLSDCIFAFHQIV
jgi:hypothetical protein